MEIFAAFGGFNCTKRVGQKEFPLFLQPFFPFFLFDFHFLAHTKFILVSQRAFLLFVKLHKLHTATKKGTGFTTTAVLFLLCLLRIRNVG